MADFCINLPKLGLAREITEMADVKLGVNFLCLRLRKPSQVKTSVKIPALASPSGA